MKQKYVTISLSAFLLISISFGMVYTGKTSQLSAKGLSSVEEIKLLPADAKDYVELLMISNNVSGMLQLFERMSPELIYSLLKKLLDDKNASPTIKIELILGTAQLFAKDKSFMNTLFKLLDIYYQKNKEYSPFLIGAKSLYQQIIPSLSQWAKEHGRFVEWTNQSVSEAIKHNDVTALENLYMLGVRPSIAEANKLLFQVIKGNKNPLFVPFLIRRFHADPNGVMQGKTPLMNAAENNYYDLARALLENKADPTIITNNAIGTASQIAFEKNDEKFVPIQLLIDRYAQSFARSSRGIKK